jgi:inorganic pyrophosphatase/exopolyphosphatase
MKKVTDKDIEMSKILIDILGLEKEETNSLYEKLSFERTNTNDFSLYEQLISDYKEYKMNSFMVGIPSIKVSIEKISTSYENYEDEFIKFSKTKKLDVLVVMSSSIKKEKFQREIILYASDQKIMQKVFEFISLEKSLLDVEEIYGFSDNLKYISQKNISSSRKVLQPLLDKFFQNFK